MSNDEYLKFTYEWGYVIDPEGILVTVCDDFEINYRTSTKLVNYNRDYGFVYDRVEKVWSIFDQAADDEAMNVLGHDYEYWGENYSDLGSGPFTIIFDLNLHFAYRDGYNIGDELVERVRAVATADEQPCLDSLLEDWLSYRQGKEIHDILVTTHWFPKVIAQMVVIYEGSTQKFPL